MIRDVNKWIKYESNTFSSYIQTRKGSGDKCIPVVFINKPSADKCNPVKIKRDNPDVCYVVYVPKGVKASDITVTTETYS